MKKRNKGNYIKKQKTETEEMTCRKQIKKMKTEKI